MAIPTRMFCWLEFSVLIHLIRAKKYVEIILVFFPIHAVYIKDKLFSEQLETAG
jgi:hypothetical protein